MSFFIFYSYISPAQASKPATNDTNTVRFDRKFSTVFKENSIITPSLSAIPANYYTQHFGFMCKKELALEKATKIPLRFRLGSLQQCNFYEGKRY